MRRLDRFARWPSYGQSRESGSLTGNLLVQGDNLEALKALLPYYAGKVQCIYIDPPYNTGNENWSYNDNVNSPEIRAWLGRVVGKEAEDLSRHDKWLCMMYPRLRILYEFLEEDGVLACSINDVEFHRLRTLLESIFGANNFLGCFITHSPVDQTFRGDARDRVYEQASDARESQFEEYWVERK